MKRLFLISNSPVPVLVLGLERDRGMGGWYSVRRLLVYSVAAHTVYVFSQLSCRTGMKFVRDSIPMYLNTPCK